MPTDPALDPARSFQELILTLQDYWADQGCLILQPYDMEMGAGTFHPATALRALGPKPWAAAFVQPSRRPKDGRYGENPNRLQHYYQFQVILKPSPHTSKLTSKSLVVIGVDLEAARYPVCRGRLGKPAAGRRGLGWEGWCDGMEVSQFTYFQQVAGFDCAPASGELTYGLERLAMYIQGVDNIYDLNFNGREDAQGAPMATSSNRPNRNIRATISSSPIPLCCSSISRGRSARRCWRRASRSPASAICWRCRPTTSASRPATPSTCSTRAA